jgi:hypothetical protein
MHTADSKSVNAISGRQSNQAGGIDNAEGNDGVPQVNGSEWIKLFVPANK